MFFCVCMFPFLLGKYPRVERMADNIKNAWLLKKVFVYWFLKMSVLFCFSSLSAWESQLLKNLPNSWWCCLVFQHSPSNRWITHQSSFNLPVLMTDELELLCMVANCIDPLLNSWHAVYFVFCCFLIFEFWEFFR